MAKRKRKKPGLNVDPKRQAHNSLRGYLYQIWHSVNAWLDLNEDEILYLEGAEDFDTVSDDTATAVQVKDTQRPITLKSQEVNDAINHYWELRMSNLDRNVKFRFLTRSKIGVEQRDPFGKKQPGLQVWSRCSGDQAVTTKISEFLQTAGEISEEVKDFLKQAEPEQIYEQLIEPITWETDSKEASFVEKSISDKLIYHGDRHSISPSDATKVVDHLLKEALTVATQMENRELTKVRFLEIFEEQTTQRVPNEYLRHLQLLATQTKVLDTASAEFLGGPSDILIQSHSPILNTVPPLYTDFAPRTELLTSIQAKLQFEGMAVIHGGAGRGKTTLAKLTVKDASDSWLWLNCTIREPSLVERESSVIDNLLKQLAIQISNQSSPVNIVLDDLNLQPQVLQGYKETLGVVVYRVLERGAKLLITSQYKPPNSLIRQLDVPPSIVVHVPDFTLAEIEQFAKQLGCPPDDVTTWASSVQLHTLGHPSLVRVLLDRLREPGWRKPNTIEDIVEPPKEVGEERGAARQLLMALPDDQREFLYRLSLMPAGFRRDYALNIAEIPESIPYAGDVLSQLVGPWIDRFNECYYTISPLLINAAKDVWSESKIKSLHAQIANAILQTRNLTQMEAQAVLFHSMAGQNEIGFIAVIQALISASGDNRKELCREFSWLIHVKPDIPEKSFPGDTFIKHLFRSLQYRIAVEVEPERAPKILEIWDEETKPYEPHQLYLLNRLMLATEALRYYQVPLSAQQLVGYFKEIIDITDNDNEVQKIYYRNYMAQFEEQETGTSNYFSILFSFIYRAPRPIDLPFFSELIDALDELPQKIRALLLADFKDDSIDSRLLIDGVWWAEANLENPDWKACLQVFDIVIDKALAWGYPHLAAASARGKAVIHDEYLHNPDAAHEALQDFIAKVGVFPSIEEEQAFVYLHQKLYKEALNIYERVLSTWNPPSEQVNLGPLEEYRRAAICAAQLNDWEKAAIFLKDGAKKIQKIEDTERYISLYADAGFAQFKAGNMLESIKLLHLALKEFEKIPQDNTNLKYFTLKQRLAHTIRWMAEQNRENNPSELVEPLVGMCSNPEPNEDFLSLPDVPTGHAWFYLAQVEYRFGHGITVLNRALQALDCDANPAFSFFLSFFQTKHDFRNQTFDNLPHRINQLASAAESTHKQYQLGKRTETEGIDSSTLAALANFASVENIISILGAALLVRLRESRDIHDILATWRGNSLGLPIKENMIEALNRIELMLFEDDDKVLTVMRTQELEGKKWFVAALMVIHDIESSPEDLFHAHVLITTSLIGSLWKDFVVLDLAELLSTQWLEKIKFQMMLKMPMTTVPDIERACKSSGTGKKKIGQILLAVYQAVSLGVSSEILQQFRSWIQSIPEQKQEPKTGQNPIAQRIIKAMEKPPHLTNEDVEALRQSIEEGKMPVKFDSPLEPDEPEKP